MTASSCTNCRNYAGQHGIEVKTVRQLGYVDVFLRSISFPGLPVEKQQKLQKKRLKKLVAYVKTKSPYFSEYYKNIGDDFTLQDLPVTTKVMMMENFDRWLSDPGITLETVNQFIADKRNMSRLLAGKYMVATTSGSTGYPAAMLTDKTARSVMTVNSVFRMTHWRFPAADVIVDDLFLLSNGMVRQNTAKMPLVKFMARNINAKLPFDKITAELNGIRPKVLSGYTGTLSLLADEAAAGNLKVSPSLVLCGGEHLSETTRTKLENTFHCTVHTLYACTEGGTMAYECSENRMHINSDWCILEPVDNNNEPVPFGKLSQKVLLTNLANSTQPIIRYELTDRVIVHDEPCPCGRNGLWIEVEGRTNDVLYFVNDDKRTGIAPLSLYLVIEAIPGVRHFQVILHGESLVELRLLVMDGADAAKVFPVVQEKIIEYLKTFGITNAVIYQSEEEPKRDPRSGKFRQIYQVFDV